MAVKLFGDWNKMPEVVSLAARFQKAVEQSLLKEAQRLRTGIVKGIQSGAPGGQQFAPLSPITLAIRKAKGFGGTKPMNVTGTLRNSIVVKRMPGAVFIGLLRQGEARNGKSPANIGEIHEFGRTWTQRMTRKSRAFLFAMLRKSGGGGPVGRDEKGRFTRGKFVRRNGGGNGGTVTITIPARPFIGPVFEQERAGIVKRFWENVAKGVGGDLGRAR